MDYLPDTSRKHPHIQVPFVEQLDFDGQGFPIFPARHGFTNATLEASSADQLGSLAQSWLYFGTLEIFLGLKINRSDFHLKHAGVDLVSAKPLVGLLSQWYSSTVIPVLGPEVVSKAATSAAINLYESARTMTKLLEDVMKQVDKLEALAQASQAPLPAILLSIRVLVVTLSGILDESLFQSDFGSLSNDYAPGRIERLRFIDSASEPSRKATAEFLVQNMVSLGWCPQMAVKICLSYNFVVAYYLSRLRDYNNKSHDGCLETKCVAHNVDMTNYHTRHTSKDCQCAHVHIDQDQVHSIIANGGIPIITFKNVAGQTELKVSKMTHKTPYVAFSHVWSDGLGNPTSNSLPRCQIERLATYIRDLQPPKLAPQQGILNLGPFKMDLQRMTRNLETSSFWLDTLCIPVGSAFMDLKIKAINSMAAIYAGAIQVLVLDSSIEQFSLDSPEVESCEMLGRVSISPWMGRSWTFQEAAISQIRQIRCLEASFNPTYVTFGHPTLFIKLFDSNDIRGWIPDFIRTCVAIYRSIRRGDADRNLLRRLVTTVSDDIRVPLVALIARPLKDTMVREFLGTKLMGNDFDIDAEEALYQRFVLCWNALCSRTTTKREDLHLIFANLLGLSASTIYNVPGPEGRMATLLLSLPYIPLSMFFSTTTIRDRPGEPHHSRWLPLFPSGEPLDLEPRVSVSKTGLVLSSPPSISLDVDHKTLDADQAKEYDGFLVRVKSRLENVSRQKMCLDGKLRFSVTMHRSENDLLAGSLGAGDALLLFRDNLALISGQGLNRTFRGVLFQVVGEAVSTEAAQINEDQQYRVVFDCPISAKFVGDTPHDLAPKTSGRDDYIHTELVPKPWQLNICQNPVTLNLPLPQRPTALFWAVPPGFSFLVLWFLWILDIVTVVLLAIICATWYSTFSHFTLAIIVVYFIIKPIPIIFIQIALPIIVPYLFDICGVLIAVLYVVSRHLSSVGQLNRLELAFVVLAMSVSLTELSVRSLYKFYVSRKMYDAWIHTFDENWSLEKETKWTKLVRLTQFRGI